MAYLLRISVMLVMVSGLGGQVPLPQHDWDWEGLARALAERVAPVEGERILLLCAPGSFHEMIPHLRYQLVRRGAVDLGCLQSWPIPIPTTWEPAVVQNGLADSREALREMLAGVDAVVKIVTTPPDPAYLAVQDLLKEGRGRSVHFHWAGAYALPGHQLPPQPLIDKLYQTAVLETDYAALTQAQKKFEDAMRGKRVRVTTPDGTDIRFRIGDRPVTRQDGDASATRAAQALNLIDREVEIPAGAIRVAPLETSVNGIIVIPVSTWNGTTAKDVRLHFEAGQVTGVEASEGLAAVQRELDSAGESSRSFREFALGFNPLLAIPESSPWIPYYGYGAGVVRLSLGDNTELGGDVGGGYVRWNFFPKATVTVEDQIWVQDGKLTVPN